MTDEAGRFEFADVPRGAYFIGASSPSHLPASLVLNESRFAREREIQVNLVLAACRRIARGLVVDLRGRPVPGARVSNASGPRGGPPVALDGVSTDAHGRFAICAPGGLLLVRAEGYGVTAVWPRSLRADAPVVVLESGSVEGTVRGSSGKPIDGARVMLDVPEPEILAVPFRVVVSDDAGRFRFEDVTPGSYDLRVYHRRHGSRGIKVKVRAHETTTATIELVDCEASITGSLRDDDGGTVPHAELVVARAMAVTDHDGAFEAWCVAPGSIHVPGYELISPTRCDEVCIAQGRVDVVVRTWRDVRGVVTIDGRSAGGALVAWRDQSLDGVLRSNLSRTTTDADGKYSIRMPRSAVEMLALSYDGTSASGVVGLDEGSDPVIVDFQLSNGHVLAGRLVQLDGQPVAHQPVHLETEPGIFLDFRREETGDDGVFQFQAVSAGAHRLGISETL